MRKRSRRCPFRPKSAVRIFRSFAWRRSSTHMPNPMLESTETAERSITSHLELEGLSTSASRISVSTIGASRWPIAGVTTRAITAVGVLEIETYCARCPSRCAWLETSGCRLLVVGVLISDASVRSCLDFFFGSSHMQQSGGSGLLCGFCGLFRSDRV